MQASGRFSLAFSVRYVYNYLHNISRYKEGLFGMTSYQQRYKRSAAILNEKYCIYMIPALLSAVGVSLSEFADSLIVGRLLNEDAFAIVNLSTPIVFMASMVYTVTGLGGSLLYAEYLAKKEKERADAYFTASTLLSLAAGLVLFAGLMLLRSRLAGPFGCPDELRAGFNRYTSYLCWFVLAGVALTNVTYFLPVVGKPFLSMGLTVAANVMNVGLDIFFIRVFGMGCEGAALATVVSYLLALVAAIVICRFQKVPLRLQKLETPWRSIAEIVRKGFPVGIVQAGYAVTGMFCNHFMNLSFGEEGVVVMSLFGQMDSVISVALSGVGDNNASFAAMLKGEGDYYGIRTLTRNVAIGVVLVCSVLALGFVCFSRPLAHLFNIHDAGSLRLVVRLTPVYVLYYPLRGLLLTLRDLYNTLDRSVYATVLGVLDKAVSIPVVGYGLYLLYGGLGLIAAFPVSMALILLLVLGVNYYIYRKSKGRYSPILLLDESNPLKALCSFTVRGDTQALDAAVEEGLRPHIGDRQLISRTCLAVEEICSYIHDNCGKTTPVDIMISEDRHSTIITCRSPGKPFYPVKPEGEKLSANELVLTKLFRIKHEYIFGLNSTSLTTGGGYEK